MVFALLALEELGSHAAGPAVAVITVTVLLSVVVHGVTADPLATRYARLLTRKADRQVGVEEHDIPERRLIRRAGSTHAAAGGAGPDRPGSSREGEEPEGYRHRD